MVALNPDIQKHRDEIVRIAAAHGACNVRVFGSMARGNAGPSSDLDLLIDLGERTSPWFPAGLVLELEALLHRKIDVVTPASLHASIRERVLREAVAL